MGGGSAIDVAKCIKLAVLAKEGNAAIIPPLVSQRLPDQMIDVVEQCFEEAKKKNYAS